MNFKNLNFIFVFGCFASFGFSSGKYSDHSKDQYHCVDKKNNKKHLKASTKETCEKEGGSWEKHHVKSDGKDHDHSH